MLVRPGELVVAQDFIFRFGVSLDLVVTDVCRHVCKSYSSAPEGKSVMYENCVAAARQLIGPSHTTVVQILMPKDDWMRVFRHPRDLSQPEILKAAVVVQTNDARQLASNALGPEQQCFCGRPIGQLPLQVFDIESVEFELMLQGGDRFWRWRGAGEAFAKTGASYAPPGIYILKPRLAKGKPGWVC
jgi:hypothetical protein